MLKTSVSAVVLLLALLLPGAGAAADGETFPNFTLRGELDREQLRYLGSDKAEVTLGAIPAPYLLIEVYSMYCPICQREAPAVNGLYEKLLPHAKTIKMLGIGTGNTPFEVAFFKDQFKVPFPLFHDEHFVVNKGLGEVGTPHFVLVKNAGDGILETLMMHEGAIEDMEAFLMDIKAGAGLE